MSDIKERLDKVRALIQESEFLEGKGLSNEVNIRIFCYEPENEMVVRHFVNQLETDQSLDCHLIVCNLYKTFLSICDDMDIIDAIPDMEEADGSAYVYLRRILERLIYQAKETAVDAIDNEMFERARVAEKIKMLEGYLPDILVKNATIYGILSKGIHELSEEECRKYFPVVKECIYQILGMWESERRKQADEDALNKALSAISSSIK